MKQSMIIITNKNKVLISAMIIFLSLSACQAGAQEKRPEVTMYAEQGVQMSLYLIFDLENQGRLCDKPSKTVYLESLSESENPWTYFLQGLFYISLEEKKGMDFGSYFFTNVKSGDVERTISAFRRKGAGEKAFGSVAGNGTLFIIEEETHKQIGEYQFMEVSTPDGEQIKTRVTHFINPVTAWIAALGDKIYQVGNNGKLIQKGWIEWRKLTNPEGDSLVILMTKGMDKNDRWAGRYDDVLYIDDAAK